MTGWRENTKFNEAMDSIYSSFMRQKNHVEGKHDREVRDPLIVIKIAEKLDLIPDKDSVIRVTGSKGKGTTSRMIAKSLEAQKGVGRVGLFVSPEEIDHNDRMRVDGVAPTRDRFANIFESIRPHIENAESELLKGQYISPFGIFLLIALKFFKEENVDVFVLEGGRGAEFDEVGNLPSKVSVVTSVFLEHAASIGPTIDDIARNKLFIGVNSTSVVSTKQVQDMNLRLEVFPPEKLIVVPNLGDVSYSQPEWVSLDAELATMAVQTFLGRNDIRQVSLLGCSAAFGILKDSKRRVFFDGSINLDSIDVDFVRKLTKEFERVIVLASLPDDKDVTRIRDFFTKIPNATYHEIALSGTRGYLHYDKAKSEGRVFEEINYEDTTGFLRILDNFAAEDDSQVIYCIGTQTYIRLVKMCFANDR